MRKASKAIALILALLMVISAMPVSVFAATDGTVPSAPGFNLIVDGEAGDEAGDDETVPAVSDPTVITALDKLFRDGNGTVPRGISLDWDDAFVSSTDINRNMGYSLWRREGDGVEESQVSTADITYSGWHKLSTWDGGAVNILVVYPDKYYFKGETTNSTNPDEYNVSTLGNVLPPNTKIIDSGGNNVTSVAASMNVRIADIFEIWTTVVENGGNTEYYLGNGTGADGYLSKYNSRYSDENSLGQGLFNIKPVPLKDKSGSSFDETFNDNYAELLADADIVFFGTWDQNGSSDIDDERFVTGALAGKAAQYNGDLTPNAAQALREYIADGYGVLFGHDTVARAENLGHTNFMSFKTELGIDFGSGVGNKTTKAMVANEGLLTTFPWTISGELTIPQTHTVAQIYADDLPATVWMTLNYPDGVSPDVDGTSYTNAKCNAYLLSNNNVALIQTGHSNGQATSDEIKVLANTLFYLKQKSLSSYAVDGDFTDEDPPAIISGSDMEANPNDYLSYKDGSLADGADGQTYTAQVKIDAEDLGTPYEYRVDSEETINGVKEEKSSNLLDVIALSELKGYLFRVTDSVAAVKTDMVSDATRESTETGRNYIEVTAEADESGVYDVAGLKADTGAYLHIVPVDNANNFGDEVVLYVNLADFYVPTVDTEVTPVIPGDDKLDPEDRVETDPTTKEETTYYYPGNYQDKDGNDFDLNDNNVPYEEEDRVSDSEVKVSISAEVDTLERDDIIGVITLTKKDEDKPGETEHTWTGKDLEGIVKGDLPVLNGTLSYDEDLAEEIVFDIDAIYDKYEDYNGDGEYTVTITWYEKQKDDAGNLIDEPDTTKPVASDVAHFVIVQPDYKVTFKYKDYDKDNNIITESVDKIVKYGDDVTAPSVKPSVKDSYLYIAKDWKLISGGESLAKVIEDSLYEMQYSKQATGSAPEQPEEPTKPTEPVKKPELIRLGGETRIETAIEISKEGWKDGAKVVILATANEFPDAMAGVPLAKAVDAPILLTVNGAKLEKIVKDEIARLNPEKVYILGQTVAVNANIENELKALYEVERVGGKDRFGTAAQIAYELEEIYGKKADAVYFVRSDLFPDALSVSSVAAIEHNPILYVAPSGKLDIDTIKYADTIGTKATIVGGPEAVTAVGEENVKNLFKSVDRIYGKDRYATSVEVCTAKNALFTGKATALATGKKFPDALTGGSFAAKNNIPVLLVNGNVTPDLAMYLANRPINTLYVFGGKLAVTDQVAYEALGYCVACAD